MVNHVFPPIDCYSEGISYFQTAEWLMIYELFHNVSQCFTCFMGVLWFRCFFGETVKPLSLRRLPLDLKASPKLTDRSWPQSEKKGQNEEINGELEHPTE